MFSTNPRADKAILKLSKEFFDPEVCKKYDRYIQLKNGYLNSINDLVNESIQTWTLPGANQDPISQMTTAPGTESGITTDITFYNQTIPLEELLSANDITISFRHLDGYINYFFLYELFFKNYLKKEKSYRFNINLTTFSQDNTICFNGTFSKCLFKSIPDIDFGYDSTVRDFKNFDCSFSFSDFSLDFELPQGKAKRYIRS